VNEQGEPSRAWRKSSYSGGGGDCVEITDDLPGMITVRDSKNADGTVLTFTPTVWVTFISWLKGN
jgi:hypothetical protein